MIPLEWKLIGGALLALLLFGGVEWWEHNLRSEGAAQCKAEVATAVAAQQASAAVTESQWKEATNAAHLVAEKQVQNLNAALAAARAASLRDRTASRVVMSPAATASCAGVSPAALSAADADVALGLAAEADRLLVYIEQVKAWAALNDH